MCRRLWDVSAGGSKRVIPESPALREQGAAGSASCSPRVCGTQDPNKRASRSKSCFLRMLCRAPVTVTVATPPSFVGARDTPCPSARPHATKVSALQSPGRPFRQLDLILRARLFRVLFKRQRDQAIDQFAERDARGF